jgi:hypothetical protein
MLVRLSRAQYSWVLIVKSLQLETSEIAIVIAAAGLEVGLHCGDVTRVTVSTRALRQDS